MTQKIKWNKPYRLRLMQTQKKVRYNFFLYGIEKINEYALQQPKKQTISLALPENDYYHFNVKKDAQGKNCFRLPDNCILESIWVKPEQLLSLEVFSKETATRVKLLIQKISKEYKVIIFRDDEFTSYSDYIISAEDLKQKLSYLDDTIEIGDYSLPLANCFTI